MRSARLVSHFSTMLQSTSVLLRMRGKVSAPVRALRFGTRLEKDDFGWEESSTIVPGPLPGPHASLFASLPNSSGIQRFSSLLLGIPRESSA